MIQYLTVKAWAGINSLIGDGGKSGSSFQVRNAVCKTAKRDGKIDVVVYKGSKSQFIQIVKGSREPDLF